MEIGDALAAARAPRPGRRFTVLLPVVRTPEMLSSAIGSVLAQTERDFELVVLGDGAPPETIGAAEAFGRSDPRVRVFSFPKGARHGEAYRAALLDGARSDFVAYIGDDDLWFPDHLARLGRALRRADVVSVLQLNVRPDGTYHVPPFGDLSLPATRTLMLEQQWNFFGPSEMGHRLSAYRRLPEGWAPGPEGLWSDLNMWRKYLRLPGLRYRTLLRATGLKLATPDWQSVSLSERGAANAAYARRLSDGRFRRRCRARARRLLVERIDPGERNRLIRHDPLTYLPLFLGPWLSSRRRRPKPTP